MPESRPGTKSSSSSWTPLRQLLVILLMAAALRFYGLVHLSPPGLAHDEVANWLIVRAILAGDLRVYFTAAYGHEAGFHYLQALSVALLGDHALALRLPAAYASLLSVAVTFALGRRLFGTRVALGAAALLAVLFYPVFYGRLGLRAISLPLFAGLSAVYWWRGWDDGNRRRRRRSFALAGIHAGLSLHTYMAARAVPILYASFTLYLWLFHSAEWRRCRQGIARFWLVYGLVALPLVVFLLANPEAEYRIAEVDAPLRALFAGDPGPALANSSAVIAMFGIRGDMLWRQNVAGWPIFDWVLAAFFYVGVLASLWRWRDSRHAFVLLWLATAVIPSILTINAPSFIRTINLLPVLTLIPVKVIHSLTKLSTDLPELSTVRANLAQILLIFIVLYHGGRTIMGTMVRWPLNEEVQFVWQGALAEAAAVMDASEEVTPIAIGGWTPHTLDRPTIDLSLKRDDLRLSFFNPDQGLLLPAPGGAPSTRILHPTILAPDPLLLEKLAAWGAQSVYHDRITLYRLEAGVPILPEVEVGRSFAGEIELVGYDNSGCNLAGTATCSLLTYWRVLEPGPDGPRRLFVHALDRGGAILAEAYALDEADARWQPHWQPGDMLVQHHMLPLEFPASAIRVGVFDPATCPPVPCRNLVTDQGLDHVLLPRAE